MDIDFEKFLESMLGSGKRLFLKRLSANDTGATGGHQVGIYVPKPVAFDLFPSLRMGGINPDALFETTVFPSPETRNTRIVWYNEGTRDECRITRWAKQRPGSSRLTKDLTGGLIVLCFESNGFDGRIEHCRAWFCQSAQEEDAFQERLETIEPGRYLYAGSHLHPHAEIPASDPCALEITQLPPAWQTDFPEAAELVDKTVDLLPCGQATVDQRLLKRRDCEFNLFRLIENNLLLPEIRKGFLQIDDFLDLANSVTNRRKARSGLSLELHLIKIFEEENLQNSHNCKTEGNKKPDFIFPSRSAYLDPCWDSGGLRMLGVKTTCKDRWRQVLNEADRIDQKHLLTLQEGVSENQFEEMRGAGIILVVPKPLHSKYPGPIRNQLMTLEGFISEIRSIRHA